MLFRSGNDDNEVEILMSLTHRPRPNFMDFFKTVDVTLVATLARVQQRQEARDTVKRTVDKKIHDKGLDLATADGNSVIQLVVDFIVGSSRNFAPPECRVIVHEMVYLYMETNECVITWKGIITIREHVSKHCKLSAEDRNAFFVKGFLAKPLSR